MKTADKEKGKKSTKREIAEWILTFVAAFLIALAGHYYPAENMIDSYKWKFITYF